MGDQKLENLLNLALGATQQERRESLELEVGYDIQDQLWELIVQFSGQPEELAMEGVQITPLLGQYAIVRLPQELMWKSPSVCFLRWTRAGLRPVSIRCRPAFFI